MTSLLIFLLLPSLSLSFVFGAESNLCFNVSGTQVELPSIKLPSQFKVSAIYTDWMKNTTSKIFEAHIDSRQAITVIKRDSPTLKWMSIGDQKFFINGTSCKLPKAGDDLPISIPPEFAFLSFKNTSVLDFLADFLSKKLKGVIRGVSVQSGVEGVRWVSCQPQNSTAPVAGSAIDVVYAGEGSFSPPVSNFSNPTLLTLTLTSYANISDSNTTISARISLQMEPFDDVKDSDPLFSTPAGLFCSDLPPVTSLPLKFPATFGATVQYRNPSGTASFSSVVYDSRKNVTTDSVEAGTASSFNESGLPADATQVVHDIVKGLEYVKSPSGCRVSSLPRNTRDLSANGTAIANPADLFLRNWSLLKFAFYEKMNMIDRTCSVYRSAQGDVVVEVLVDETGSLHVVREYYQGSLNASYEYSFTTVDTVPLLSSLHDCFNVSGNSTFSVIIPGKSLAAVSVLSSTGVSYGLANSFSALLPRFSSHRLRFFFSDEKDALRVIFSISDPAMVTGEMENSTKEFVEALNQTLTAKDFTVTVVGSDGKTQDWTVAKSSLMPYPSAVPHKPDSPYVGYSGGSMFVLGIFMLLFGVLIGAGGVYVVTRRLNITNLAYQVFE